MEPQKEIENSRMSRSDWWWENMVYFFTTGAAALFYKYMNGTFGLIISLLIMLFCIIRFTQASAKRLHDLNQPGWLAAVGIIPILGWLILVIPLGFIKGTNGPNRFGKDPTQKGKAAAVPGPEASIPEAFPAQEEQAVRAEEVAPISPTPVEYQSAATEKSLSTEPAESQINLSSVGQAAAVLQPTALSQKMRAVPGAQAIFMDHPLANILLSLILGGVIMNAIFTLIIYAFVNFLLDLYNRSQFLGIAIELAGFYLIFAIFKGILTSTLFANSDAYDKKRWDRYAQWQTVVYLITGLMILIITAPGGTPIDLVAILKTFAGGSAAGFLAGLFNLSIHSQNDKADILCELPDSRAVEPLIGRLQNGKAEVRAQSAIKLGELGDERAVIPLARLIKDRDARVRRAVVEALDHLGKASTRDLLVQVASRDPDEEVRAFAREAVRELDLRNRV